MKCEICGKDILKDSQCIDYKYYHNDCIINLTKENQELKKQLEELKSILERCICEDDCSFDNPILGVPTFLDKMEELERGKE